MDLQKPTVGKRHESEATGQQEIGLIRSFYPSGPWVCRTTVSRKPTSARESQQ